MVDSVILNAEKQFDGIASDKKLSRHILTNLILSYF